MKWLLRRGATGEESLFVPAGSLYSQYWRLFSFFFCSCFYSPLCGRCSLRPPLGQRLVQGSTTSVTLALLFPLLSPHICPQLTSETTRRSRLDTITVYLHTQSDLTGTLEHVYKSPPFLNVSPRLLSNRVRMQILTWCIQLRWVISQSDVIITDI